MKLNTNQAQLSADSDFWLLTQANLFSHIKFYFSKYNSKILYKIGFILQIEKSNTSEHRALLEKCAATALSSKLIHQQKDFFSKIVVDAVLSLDDLLPLNMIGIKKVQGGALEVSQR